MSPSATDDDTVDAPHAAPTSRRAAALRVAFGLMAVACLVPAVTAPVALATGAAFSLVLGNPAEALTKRWSKVLLQASVVLLGFSMNFTELLRVGMNGALFAAASIVVTLGAGYAVGRWLKLPSKAATLIAVGTAVCGGSAIAAVGPVIAASAAEMSVALGTVFTFNAVALYVFPAIGKLVHLTGPQFGTWAGIAIHDISSVVGAASSFGQGALPVATAVKLSRTLWIIPLTLATAFLYARGSADADAKAGFDANAPSGTTSAETRPGMRFPWFIGLFALASVLRTFVPGVAAIVPWTTLVSRAGLTVTLFLVGAGLTRSTLRAAGWRSLLLGASLWVLIGGGSLAIILMTR